MLLNNKLVSVYTECKALLSEVVTMEVIISFIYKKIHMFIIMVCYAKCVYLRSYTHSHTLKYIHE